MFLKLLKTWLKLNLALLCFALVYFLWPLLLVLGVVYLIGFSADRFVGES